MIRFDHITLQYSSKVLLKGYSASFSEKQLIGITGPNGAGKTSFLKVLAGIDSSYTGDILVSGKSLRDFSLKELASLRTYVPATPLCYWDLSTNDVLSLENSSFHSAHPLLIRLKVQSLLSQKFSTLSSGEKARVFLAYSLIKDHPFVILDEITSHLDEEYQHRTLQLLQEEAQKGKIIFLALHQKNLALDYCDQVLWLGNQTFLPLKQPHSIAQGI